MQVTKGQWVPLVEYAVRRNVSLSTLRRHIKASKVEHKKVAGKYLIWDESESSTNAGASAVPSVGAVRFAVASSEVEVLKSELHRAHREITELKTLIALYEERMPNGF